MFYSTRVFFVISLFAGSVSASVVPRTQVDRRSQSIPLNGNNYNVVELPKLQSKDTRTFAILGGFRLDNGSEPTSAIMKIIQRNRDSEADALKEIDYLKVVGLHLFTKIDDYAYFIVIRDVRKYEFPLKPYQEWYLEDSSRNLDKDLGKLRTNIKRELIKYAEERKLCYENIHFSKIYVDEGLETVMPIDWGPAVGDMPGITEVRQKGDTEKCEFFLSKYIPTRITCKHLLEALEHSNDKLRPEDRELGICT